MVCSHSLPGKIKYIKVKTNDVTMHGRSDYLCLFIRKYLLNLILMRASNHTVLFWNGAVIPNSIYCFVVVFFLSKTCCMMIVRKSCQNLNSLHSDRYKAVKMKGNNILGLKSLSNLNIFWLFFYFFLNLLKLFLIYFFNNFFLIELVSGTLRTVYVVVKLHYSPTRFV